MWGFGERECGRDRAKERGRRDEIMGEREWRWRVRGDRGGESERGRERD